MIRIIRQGLGLGSELGFRFRLVFSLRKQTRGHCSLPALKP